MTILCEIQKSLDAVFNDTFCTHLLHFLIENNLTTADFKNRGTAFFKQINDWTNNLVLKKEHVQLFGIMGWHFHITVMEFLFDFYSEPQAIDQNALIMFLTYQFGNLDNYEYARFMNPYNEAFYQKYYPEFQELFLGKENSISDFEKNICANFQFEFSQGCVTQLTKNSFIQDLENFETISSRKFLLYCDPSEQTSVNHTLIDILREEYPKYQSILSVLRDDADILQVFRMNEHNCENTLFYLATKQNSTYFLAIEDFM